MIGTVLEEAFVSTYVGPSDSQPLFPHHFVCVPCPPGCTHCDSGHRACLLSYSSPTRVLLLGLQCFAVFVSVLLILIVFRLRRSKVSKSIQNHFHNQINSKQNFDCLMVKIRPTLFIRHTYTIIPLSRPLTKIKTALFCSFWRIKNVFTFDRRLTSFPL